MMWQVLRTKGPAEAHVETHSAKADVCLPKLPFLTLTPLFLKHHETITPLLINLGITIINHQNDRELFGNYQLSEWFSDGEGWRYHIVVPTLNWLVVYLPLWKIWKSIGMMTFPIYGKIRVMFQSHVNQILITINHWTIHSHQSLLWTINHYCYLWFTIINTISPLITIITSL